MDLGKRIRQLRKKRGMTLLEVSKKSGVALATLSRIETGRMTGTLESHTRIARTFDMGLPEFYSEMDSPATAQSKDDYADVFVHDKKTSSVILTKDVLNKRMLPQLVGLQPSARTAAEQFKKGAEKFIYVLQGKIELVVGDTRNDLEKGATLYLDASCPHYARNTGNSTAEFLSVLTPAIL
ncbi:MAG: cupin domain-containing protein [Candidatus Omnitrophica bacterium]|nr:cupin domain-containing protein [Candidatus Omnitrophota bacterium]